MPVRCWGGVVGLTVSLAACAPDPTVLYERQAAELGGRPMRPGLAAAVVSTPREPRLVDLVASGEPRRVRRDQVVDLRLVYEVTTGAGDALEVTEERRLSFGGSVLPNYPVTARFTRASGRYTTNYAQRIPPSASLGVYELRAEVCMAGRCLAQTVVFEVVP